MIEVAVEKPVYRGLGLARHEGQVVFVPRALPGERWRVRLARVERGYAEATGEDRLSAAPGRRQAPCPHFAACGGCAFQDVEPAVQRDVKRAVVRDALARAGVPWTGELPVVESPPLGWRMRADLHVEARGSTVRLGLHAPASNRVVDFDRCLQLSDGMNRTAAALRAALASDRALAAGVDHVALAESADGTALVAAAGWTGALERIGGLGPLADAVPWASGVGALVGDRYVGLRGEPFVYASAGGVRFRWHLTSFFQGNRFLLESLVEHVRSWVLPGVPLVDLYAGVGLFALTLAPHVERVVAVEGSRQAVQDAAANLAAAGASNVRLVEGDVLARLRGLPGSGEQVVLDPPRAGAGPEVVAAIAARHPPNVVYVSCDPPTLARDLKAFRAAGYEAVRVQAFDLFPDTFHVETVVQLVSPGHHL